MPTTPEEFEQFKAECLKWIKYFGLTDWKVRFSHEEGDSTNRTDSSVAWTKANGTENRAAVLCLNKMSDDDDERPFLDIKLTAFHEVCELLTWPLEHIGTCRYVQPEEFTEARHALIRRLENTIFRDVDPFNEDRVQVSVSGQYLSPNMMTELISSHKELTHDQKQVFQKRQGQEG
ncbi:MAG: hypothetical protein PHY29_02735 [Syntrophales bacterium]|nr:hypothetical protein [Syntrophales bacterium]